MDGWSMETDRLVLRRFRENDMKAIFQLFSDKETNTFLPWYPVKNMDEAERFFEKRLNGRRYCFAEIGRAHV